MKKEETKKENLVTNDIKDLVAVCADRQVKDELIPIKTVKKNN